MRKLESQAGIELPSTDYPKGRIKNNQTLVNEEINGDIVQFFHRMVQLAGITENNLPDNVTNTFQLLTALETVTRTFASTLTSKGTIELATLAEVIAGIDATRAVCPSTLLGAFNGVRNAILPIGVWNMDTSSFQSVTWALPANSYILNISVRIYNDSGSDRSGVNFIIPNPVTFAVEGCFEYNQIEAAFVLTRKTGGFFDANINYQAGGFNRGNIIVEYAQL